MAGRSSKRAKGTYESSHIKKLSNKRRCWIKGCKNPSREPEKLLVCTKVGCGNRAHPQCLGFPEKLTEVIRRRPDWLCSECNFCSICFSEDDQKQLAKCWDCDRAVHIQCAYPKLSKVPQGYWSCASTTQVCVGSSRAMRSSEGIHHRARARGRGRDSTGRNSKRTRANSSDSDFNVSDEDFAKTDYSESSGEVFDSGDEITLDGSQSDVSGEGSVAFDKIALARKRPAVSRSPNTSHTPQKKNSRRKPSLKLEIPTSPSAERETLSAGSQPQDEPEDVWPPAECTRNVTRANLILTQKDLNLYAATVRDFEKHKEQPSLPSTPRSVGKSIIGPDTVEIAGFNIDTLYSSPLPPDFKDTSTLFVCESCLKFFKTRTDLKTHIEQDLKCHKACSGVPGNEIYRQDKLSMWEIDGQKQRVFCQNLCLLAKMFLDSKTLYYNVETFLFYVLTEWTDYGLSIIGYFSKEKESFLNYNLSCILVLPHYQRRGYGHLLIDFSYLLSKKEGKKGTPEKPLSDMGLLAYRRYWTDVILAYIDHHKNDKISIKQMSDETSLNTYDIISTLQSLSMIKYWRTNHVIVSRPELVTAKQKRYQRRRLDPFQLQWAPQFARIWNKRDNR